MCVDYISVSQQKFTQSDTLRSRVTKNDSVLVAQVTKQSSTLVHPSSPLTRAQVLRRLVTYNTLTQRSHSTRTEETEEPIPRIVHVVLTRVFNLLFHCLSADLHPDTVNRGILATRQQRNSAMTRVPVGCFA